MQFKEKGVVILSNYFTRFSLGYLNLLLLVEEKCE